MHFLTSRPSAVHEAGFDLVVSTTISCSRAASSTGTLISFLQTEQNEPSVLPFTPQEAGVPLTISSLWPVAGIVVQPSITKPQTLHFLPTELPASVQVASLAATAISVHYFSFGRIKKCSL